MALFQKMERSLSDKEFYDYVAKVGENMDRAVEANWELEYRHQLAVRKLLAMAIGVQMAAPSVGKDDILDRAKWAYKEATGEEWPPNRGPNVEERS